MKISMISIGDEFLNALPTTGGLLPPFIIEGNAKFHLEVSEDEDVTFPTSEFSRASQFYPWILG